MPQDEIKALTTENTVVKGVGKKVRPKDNVIVVGTEKSKSLATGVEYTVHSALAEKLVAKGSAAFKDKKEAKK